MSFPARLGMIAAAALLLLTSAGRALALEDFTRTLNLTYTVLESGQTRVKYEVRLKNNLSTVYAKQYALTLNSTDVSEIEVRDADGKALPWEQDDRANQTSIMVKLDQNGKVIGRDKERLFTISYLSQDAASIYGRVLEVSVPRLAAPLDYAQYNVVLNVPAKFGPPSLVEPARYTFDSVEGLGVLRFTNVGQESGISALFGDSQTYDLRLTYHVANTAQNIGVVQVALPPDNRYQRIVYRSLVPAPERITLDPDGNWIAEFRVAGQAKQSIVAEAQITALARPQSPLPVVNPSKPGQGLFGAEVDYLRSTGYWPANQVAIKALAQQYQTPLAIYQYVVDALQYNYRRFQQSDARIRLGAAGALADPANAVCLEFADLFIAIARSAGIPARRATGYAVTENNRLRPLSLVADVLHAWPEYYDQQQNAWVAVDPTWADTTGGVDYFSKLDLRHLTFAVQGQNDELPYPAGLYKVEGEEQKDVQVELADEVLEPGQKLTVTQKPSIIPRWGLPKREIFVITNETGAARYNMAIAVGVDGPVSLLSSAKVQLPVLLPYESYELAVELSGTSWLTPQSATLNLYLGEQEEKYEVIARRALYHPLLRWILVGAVIVVFSASTGGVLVFLGRRFRAVRR
jgi:transglutaminase-like putative cysteine protease